MICQKNVECGELIKVVLYLAERLEEKHETFFIIVFKSIKSKIGIITMF